MSLRKAFLAAVGLATLSSGVVSQSSAVTPVKTVSKEAVKPSESKVKPVAYRRQKGGSRLNLFGRESIPPQVYGERFVKARTHKRTNK